jgi:hypothetical protein
VRTEDLIEALALHTPAQPAAAVPRRLAAAVGVGALAAFAVLLAWLGLRPDLAQAARGVFFWIKLAYPLALALAGAALVERYGRPDGQGGRRWLLVAAPVVVLALIALASSLGESPPRLMADWLGRSWRVCAFHVLALSAPAFAATLWAFRRLAPTRPRLAGFAAGLMAGGTGAAVYCLACAEATALFVVTWYSLGVFACAAIGALLGPRLLKW